MLTRFLRSVVILACENNAGQSLPYYLVRLGSTFAKEIYPSAMDASRLLQRKQVRIRIQFVIINQKEIW